MFPIIFISLLGGLGPGLIATFVVAFETAFIFPKPYILDDIWQWGVLAINGILVCILSERLFRSRQKVSENWEKYKTSQIDL
jgi:hypothetical protein